MHCQYVPRPCTPLLTSQRHVWSMHQPWMPSILTLISRFQYYSLYSEASAVPDSAQQLNCAHVMVQQAFTTTCIALQSVRHVHEALVMLGSSPYVSADTLRQLAATSTAAGSTRSCANLQVDQSIDSEARRHTGCHARGGMLRRACADLYSFGRE